MLGSDSRWMCAMVALLVLAVAAGASLAGNDDSRDVDDDRRSAYEARKKGRILALSDILAKLALPKGAEIVEIEFEEKHGVPIYEIYFVDERGRRREIEVDAQTGRLIGEADD